MVTLFAVAADDRSGAVETAGLCAEVGLGKVVVPGPGRFTITNATIVVTDLGSRHCSAAVAAGRAVRANLAPALRHAHKIDSTLRGNWAFELVARQRLSDRPVLIVPAFPQLGRACTQGVVTVDGLPVDQGIAGMDPLNPVWSSRPATSLEIAGIAADDVAQLATRHELDRWLEHPCTRFAVCDATSEEDLTEIAIRWAAAEPMLFAGTSASIASAAAACCPRIGQSERGSERKLAAPTLIVCGSLHPGARAELLELASRGVLVEHRADRMQHVAAELDNGRSAVMTTATIAAGTVDPRDARATARRLGQSVNRLLTAGRVGTVVIVGGDTVAAVLGQRSLIVEGCVGPGVPCGHFKDGNGPTVVTRAGGFGRACTLSALLSGMIGS